MFTEYKQLCCLYSRTCKSTICLVSALGNVRKLNLSGCTGITDVSALGDVEYLDLSFCREIKDVSTLGPQNINSLAVYIPGLANL